MLKRLIAVRVALHGCGKTVQAVAQFPLSQPSTSMVADEKQANGDTARGLPYYERLKRDIRETLLQKQQLDKKLLGLEDSIYKMETSYLEDTAAGNIIKGFDNYIKGSSASANVGGGSAAARKKSVVQDTDRIFSRSSVSLQRESSPDSQTPSHAPTPSNASVKNESNAPTPTSSTHKGTVPQKRSKKGEKDEDDDAKPKRLKITYSRGDKD